MTRQRHARQAYEASATPIRTPKASEYEAFARITHKLAQSARQGRSGFAALAQAVYENRRLWTTLAASVADTANALPSDLRARIFYLAEFTESQSQRILAGKASVAPLIEINTAVMRGLQMERS